MDADKQAVREFSSFVKSITLTLFIVHNAFTLKQELALFKVEMIPCDRKKVECKNGMTINTSGALSV